MIRKITKRIIIALVMITLVGIVAVVFAIASRFTTGKQSSPRMEAKIQDGVEFGKTTNQQGCIDEGLKRGARQGILDFDDQADNDNFVLGCLESSAPNPGFCDGVPSGVKNIFVDWTEKKCEKINMPRPICTGVFDQQIRFCEH
jgi:hypothetical protein